MTSLPLDIEGNPVPVLGCKSVDCHKLDVSNTATGTTRDFDTGTKVVSIYSSVAGHVKFGDAGVTATITDGYFPAGGYLTVKRPDWAERMSFISRGDVGEVFITEFE